MMVLPSPMPTAAANRRCGMPERSRTARMLSGANLDLADAAGKAPGRHMRANLAEACHQPVKPILLHRMVLVCSCALMLSTTRDNALFCRGERSARSFLANTNTA
jgi:hypothetical protein